MYKYDTSSSPDFDPIEAPAPAPQFASATMSGGGASIVGSVRGAPRLLSSNPVDGLGNVNPDGVTVQLYFNEAVARGNGYIYITDGVAQTVIDRASGKLAMRIVGATDTRVISVSDTSKVTVANGSVQISAGDLLDGVSYNVLMSKGVFTDLDGNAFAGITSSAALNFTTADPPPLATIALDRAIIGTGQTATVTVTFSEAVQELDETALLVPSGTLGSFTANAARTVWTATFTPSLNHQDDTNLITLPGSAFRDLGGNAGTGSYSSANYIVDNVHPLMTSAVTRTGLTAGSSISITFNEAVYWEDNSPMTLTVGGVTTNIWRTDVMWSLDHKTLTVPASALSLVANKTYTLALPASLGDQAGNAPTTTSVTLDTTVSAVPTPSAPDLTLASDTGGYVDGVTTDTTPSFWIGGTVVGGTIKLYDNGVLVGEMAASSIGFTEFTASPRSFGTHLFTVKNTDGYGNESMASAATTVEITDALIHIDPVAGSNMRSGQTAQVTFSFAKAVSSLDASAFTVANGMLSGFAGSGTAWTAILTPSAGIDDATNILQLNGASLTFSDGTHGVNASYSSRNYVIDTVVQAYVDPLMTIIDDGRSTSDGVTSEDDQTISGTYTGTLATGETIQLVLGNGIVNATVDTVARTWSWSGNVGVGGESVLAYVTNGAHMSAVASKSFTVDQSGPVATDGATYTGVVIGDAFYLSFNEELYWDDDSTLTLQGNDQTVYFTAAQLGFANGQAWLEIPASLHQMIAGTSYTISLPTGLADKVGNAAATTSYSLSTMPDTTAPRATGAYVTSGAGNYKVGDTIVVVVRFSEAVRADGAPELAFEVGSGAGVASYVSGNGSTDLVLNYVVAAGDQAGNLTLRSIDLAGQVTDLAGNVLLANGVEFNVLTRVGGGSIGIAIDGVAPGAPGTPDLTAASDSGYSSSDDITNDDTPSVSGSGADPYALMHLKNGSAVVGTGYADISGAWTLTASSALSGTVALTAVQFDGFYNASPASTPLTVTIDTDTPDISGATSGNGTALSISFDETVRFTSGAIEVRDGNNTLMRTITSADTTWYSLSGTVLTLHAAGLADGTYTVKLSGDAIQDVAGNFTAELVGSNPGQAWYVGVTA